MSRVRQLERDFRVVSSTAPQAEVRGAAANPRVQGIALPCLAAAVVVAGDEAAEALQRLGDAREQRMIEFLCHSALLAERERAVKKHQSIGCNRGNHRYIPPKLSFGRIPCSSLRPMPRPPARPPVSSTLAVMKIHR